MDNTQVQREEHRQRRSQSLLEQLRRGLAKRPHIRSRLLSIPPHGWVLAGGRRILPRAVRTSINRAYEFSVASSDGRIRGSARASARGLDARSIRSENLR